MRCRKDVVGDFRRAFGQITLGLFTFFLLTNTLSKVVLRIEFVVKVANGLGGRIWSLF